MSQESVAQITPPNPPNSAQPMEDMMRQLTNEVAQVRDMVGELRDRVRTLEGTRSAPPQLGANPPPPPQAQGREPHRRQPPYVPPPIPPYRGGHGRRGQGRGDPRQRLYEQEMGAQMPDLEEDTLEDGFREYDGRNEQRPPPRGRDYEDGYDEDPLEDRHGFRPQPRPYNPRGRYQDSDYEEYEPRRPPRYPQPRRRFHEDEDEFKDIKINIPNFDNARNPETYLQWERKVEMAFEFREYTERKKLKLVTQEFSGYALTWWDDLNRKRVRNGEGPITSWIMLRREMRSRFVPSNYERELHHKLQWLTQGGKSVEEYYEDMQSLLLRANLEESEEALLARFSRGLNREIYNVVELQTYVNMEELLDKAIKVERQLRVAKFKGASTSSPYQKNTWNRGEVTLKKPMEPQNTTKPETNTSKPPFRPPSKPWQNQPSTQQSKYPPPQTPRTRDVTCFKCQGKGHYARECANKRVLLVDEQGDYYSGSEGELEAEEDTIPFQAVNEDKNVEEDVMVEKGKVSEMLVLRRILSAQVKEEKEDESTIQRENIFHARCKIKDKVCSLIIDNGSCANVASAYMVEKLGLPLIKHPKPYKLQWLSEDSEVRVMHQVLVPFSISKFKDEVLCDVVPMQASHMLLGRPWQFDRDAIYYAFSNKYTIIHQEKKYTLAPLLPHKVLEDHQRLYKQMVGHFKPAKVTKSLH